MTTPDLLATPAFPRSSRYNPAWIVAGASGGANPLWLTEWLAGAVILEPGMRVLDLGCGRALSSIFLRREFGVEVWAVDLWFSAAENLARARDAGVGDGVFPLHADARALPFAPGFFDVIVSIDSFVYYGTDALYMNDVARFLKPEGVIAIAGAGTVKEVDTTPPHLQTWWEPAMCCLHSADWWKRHWERSGVVTVDVADTMPDGWRRWLDWQRTVSPDNEVEIRAIEADAGRCMSYVRVVARRRTDIVLEDPIVSIATTYQKRPLLRASR